MSIRLMTKVWEHSACEGAELLLMLALADWANDDGYCWPAVSTLAQKARVGKRYAQRLLKSLEQKGEVSRVGRHGRAGVNLYHITPGGGLQATPPDGLQATPPLAPRPPDPPLEPPPDPPKGAAKAARPPDPLFEQMVLLCYRADTGEKIKALTGTERNMANRACGELRKVQATPLELGRFGTWWSTHDWRGKKGEPPGPMDVVKSWSRYRNGGKPQGQSEQQPQSPADAVDEERQMRARMRGM